jgi:biotin carboxylase
VSSLLALRCVHVVSSYQLAAVTVTDAFPWRCCVVLCCVVALWLRQVHVIAARITAENTDSGFTPTSGAVSELNFRSTPSVWGYFSVDSSGRVHEFADSQIGHLFSWGRHREEARRNMVTDLKRNA